MQTPRPNHAKPLSTLAAATALLWTIALPVAPAQEIHFDTGPAPVTSHAQRVTLENDTFSVDAGKPGWIDLRFHIAPGLHINSHMPGDETLIPTTFTVDPASPLHPHRTEFPAGVPYHLQTGSGETLNTYQDDFSIRIELMPPIKGDSSLSGKLHYQACNNASCFPARDLPVQLTIHAR